MKSEEIRKAVIEMCQDFADARLTGNPRVLNAVATDIEFVRLQRLFPDKPTLAEVLQQQEQ